jgi:hypothetical protein
MSKKELEIEERLLRKKELEEKSREINFELAKIIEFESRLKKKKELQTDFNKLKFVSQGDRMLSSEAFSRNAIYEYLNEKEQTITLFNGIQAEATFGTNIAKKESFGMLEEGSLYRVPGVYTLRFKHFEIN